MGIVDRTIDAGGGAVKDGFSWGIKGLLFGAAAGAAIGAGIVAAIGAAITAPVSIPLLAASAVVAGAAGALIGGGKGVIWGGALGAIKGGVTGAMGTRDGQGKAPSLDQQIDQERARSVELANQIAARQRAASGYNNPDATGGHVARTQGGAPQQGHSVGTSA